jgi:agmatinase
MHRSLSRRIAELPNIAKIIQIGVRDFAREGIRREQRERGIRTFSPRMLRTMGESQVLKEIPQGSSLYLSVDLDVLDPSIAPGVTEPVQDGLHYRELKKILTAILEKGKPAGFDITELNPSYDPGGFTALMGARLLALFLSHCSR